MYIIHKKTNSIEKVPTTTFKKLEYAEREHLQEWIANTPMVFDEELLIIQKEFAGFDDTKERLDLLAIDTDGNLVVIENKLDDSGRDVTWQALKYASYCSSLKVEEIKEIYHKYLIDNGKHIEEETSIDDFLKRNSLDETDVNKSQRIIMVAGEYRKEVTSTVMWLINSFNVPIQCFKATPYKYNDQEFLSIEEIIPIKEAKDYIIKMAEKHQAAQSAKSATRERDRLLLDFWNQFLEQANQEFTLFSNVNTTRESWMNAGSGMSGVTYSATVTQTSARVELYIGRSSKEENKQIFDQLFNYKDEIERTTGPMVWMRMNDRKTSRIKIEMEGIDIYNKQDWQSFIDFFIEKLPKLEKAFKDLLNTINIQLKNG